MKNEFIVPPHSGKEIRTLAKMVRGVLDPDGNAKLDIVRALENVLSKHDSDIEMEIVEDLELKGKEAETFPDDKRIRIARSVYDNARKGSGRDRFTIAHEIGHLFLHQGLQLSMARPNPNQKIPAFFSSEWQASSFAGYILMPIEHFKKCSSAKMAARVFGVSEAAANTQARAYMRDGLFDGWD